MVCDFIELSVWDKFTSFDDRKKGRSNKAVRRAEAAYQALPRTKTAYQAAPKTETAVDARFVDSARRRVRTVYRSRTRLR